MSHQSRVLLVLLKGTYQLTAISMRSSSVSRLSGCGSPATATFGSWIRMLLYPYAIATSSAMSHACKISLRVGGTWTTTYK